MKGRSRPASVLAQGIRVIQMLRESPRRPGDLAATLGVTRRTVERILRTIAESGEPLTVERDGREAWYQIDAARRPAASMVSTPEG